MVSLSLTLDKINDLIAVYDALEKQLGPPTPIGRAEIDSLHSWREVIIHNTTALELTPLPTCVEDCDHIIEKISELEMCRNTLIRMSKGVEWIIQKSERKTDFALISKP